MYADNLLADASTGCFEEKELFGTKSEIISITVDPNRDTPAVLKEFGSKFESSLIKWLDVPAW